MNIKKILSKQWWMPLAVILILLIIWEVSVRLLQIPLYVLPAPSKIVLAFIEEFPTLVYHGSATAMEAILGLVIAVALGVVLGVLMDGFPTFKSCIYPILVVTQTVPVIVLAPIFIIYLGFGAAPKILTVVLMCFFPVVISFCDGMSTLNEGYLHLLKTYGGNKWQLYRLIKLPAAMMSLLSGLKVAATYSISGAVVGEWISSQKGLGYYMLRVKNSYMLDKVFACVLLIVLLSLIMNGAVRLLQYLLMPQEHRRKRRGGKGNEQKFKKDTIDVFSA